VFADKTLRQMAAYMPTDNAQFSQLHGIGTHKLATYGKAFLEAIADFLQQHPEAARDRQTLTAAVPSAPSIKRQRGETYQITLDMLRQGLSLEAIAKARGVVMTTVEGHVAQLIESGEDIDWKSIVPADTASLLRTLFEQHGSGALAPIIAAADGAASYGQARILRAVLAAESADDS
jgi:ATP-dependent DNA helicase RecQ